MLLLTVCVFGWAAPISAQSPPEVIKRWVFTPQYRLLGNAAGPARALSDAVHTETPLVELEPPPILIRGAAPTQRIRHLLLPEQLPQAEFTLEMWICHHVNTPVDAIVALRGGGTTQTVPWIMGFGNWQTFVHVERADGQQQVLQSRIAAYSGFKERWIHQVLSYDGHDLKLYVNGEPRATAHLHANEMAWPQRPEIEMASYMHNEPEMQFGNLVQEVSLYSGALDQNAVQARFALLQQRVEDGRLDDDVVHFTAGPYLNYCDQSSVRLCWETDRPTTARICWGTNADLERQHVIEVSSRKHDFVIASLDASTPYFYEVIGIDEETGEELSSGVLTFKTAVEPEQPFRFAVIGDTESRPHINDRLAKQIWNARPNFVVNLGDLTDGGNAPHRYEWTYEYFVGITQLASRIPFFAVPGNGEGDLVWYKHYHNYPGEESYYQFQFGNAHFFMLDSNRREQEFAPGGKQYIWLEEQLSRSEATWKFVCHHHATYTGEENDYGDSWKGPSQFGDEHVRQIVPLYEKYGVDMVLFGHLHLYERSLPIRDGKVDPERGTIHLLAGGGGGNLEDFAPTPAFFSAQTHRGHHYVTVNIHQGKLELRMHDLEGDLRDILTLEKGIKQGLLKVRRGPESVQGTSRGTADQTLSEAKQAPK